MVRQWRLPNYFASKIKKISLSYYFSWRHAIKISSGQTPQVSRRTEMIHPTIGWRRDEHGTQKHAHDSWILWSVSRVRSKTMHSLSCITSWLSYITLCYIAEEEWTSSHNALRFKVIYQDFSWRHHSAQTLEQVRATWQNVLLEIRGYHRSATFQRTISLFALLVRDALNLFFVMLV